MNDEIFYHQYPSPLDFPPSQFILHSSFITHHSSLDTHYSPFTIDHSPPFVYHNLLFIDNPVNGFFNHLLLCQKTQSK